MRQRPVLQQSPGRASSSSAMPAATTRAARAHVRARRQDRQDRLRFYLVPKVEGDPVRGPGSLAARRRPGRTFRVLRSVVAEPGLLRPWTQPLGFLYVPVGNPAPDFDNSVRRRQSLHRLRRWPRRQNRRTGAPFQLVPRAARLGRLQPAGSVKTMGGKRLMAVSPKDGHLYGFDLAGGKLLYRTPVTQIEDMNASLSTRTSILSQRPRAEMEQPGLRPSDQSSSLPTSNGASRSAQTRKNGGCPARGGVDRRKGPRPFSEFGEFSRADRVWAG